MDPVLVTVTILATPATVTLTLLFNSTFTLLDPLTIVLPALTLRLDNPPPSPVNTPVLAVNATAVTVPLTPNPVNVPTLVILPCAAVVNEPVKLAAPIVPELA